jgi:hypothetical protein
VIKHHCGRRLVAVTRRVVLGTAQAIAAALAATGTGTGINTSYIERLNATFRAALSPLVRRGRAIVHGEGVLTGWMYLVGCAYNFCWDHDSLRVAAPPGERLKWRAQTPAMAAGLTDHTVDDARAVELPDSLAALGRSEAPGATAQAISGPPAGPHVTTVPCGATNQGLVLPKSGLSVGKFP